MLFGASSGTKQSTSTGAREHSFEGSGMKDPQSGMPSQIKDHYGEHSLKQSADEPSTKSIVTTSRKRENPEASTHLPLSKHRLTTANVEGKLPASAKMPHARQSVKFNLTETQEDFSLVHPSMSQDQEKSDPIENLSVPSPDLLPKTNRPGDINQSSSRKRPSSFVSSPPPPSKSPRLSCQDVQTLNSPDVDISHIDALPTIPIASNRSHHATASRESSTIEHTASGVRDDSMSSTPNNSNSTNNKKKVMEQTPQVPPIASASMQINNAIQPSNMPTHLVEPKVESDSMPGSDDETCESSTSTDDSDSDTDQTDSEGHTSIDEQTMHSSLTFPDVTVGSPSKKASDSTPGRRGGCKSNLTQSKLLVRRPTKDGDGKSTRLHELLPRKKSRHSPRVHSKPEKKPNVRKTRCAKGEKHLCPVCSLLDCGKCKNCL